MSPPLVLVSHTLCPYVQRVAIVLAEKGLAFKRRDIDLAHKPDWFTRISPLGKTPVLLVNGEPIFESAAICEFLDETVGPRLHPDVALERARHRAWMAFGSSLLSTIGAFYNAKDTEGLTAQAAQIRLHLQQLEAALGAGPYFGGDRFSLVDVVFGPVFRYFDVFDALQDFGFFEGLIRVPAWRARLAERPSVRGAAHARYTAVLREFLRDRGSALSRLAQEGSPAG